VEKNYIKTKEFALIVVGIVVMMIQNKDNISIKTSSGKDIPIILGLLLHERKNVIELDYGLEINAKNLMNSTSI
jgi:hypothetical protein